MTRPSSQPGRDLAVLCASPGGCVRLTDCTRLALIDFRMIEISSGDVLPDRAIGWAGVSTSRAGAASGPVSGVSDRCIRRSLLPEVRAAAEGEQDRDEAAARRMPHPRHAPRRAAIGAPLIAARRRCAPRLRARTCCCSLLRGAAGRGAGRDGGCRDPARRASASAADLAARPAAGGPRPRRRAAGDRGQQHHRDASWARSSPWRKSPRRPRRRSRRWRRCLGRGVRFVATLADADTTLALADAAGDRALILNALAPDDRLRGADCRANLLHLAPSRAMLDRRAGAVPDGEALGPTGSSSRARIPRTRLLAEAYRHAGREVRRSASSRRGSTRIPAAPAAPTPDTSRSRRRCRSSPSARPSTTCWSRPTRARSSPRWLPYHTWDARPVAGSAGLTPTTWHPAHGGLGRHPAPDPLREAVEPADAPRGLQRLDGAPRRRRGGHPNAVDRPGDAARLYPRPRLRARRLQGPAGDVPRLGRPAPPADPARRRQRRGLGLAAGRVRAPVLAARHPRHRPSRDRMPPADRKEPPCATSSPPRSSRRRRAGGRLHGLRQQRARQLDHRSSTARRWRWSRRSRSASARAAST